MTSTTNQPVLVDLDAVSRATTPIARLNIEPDLLSELKGVQFQKGFDGLDYLVFSNVSLPGGETTNLVRHENAPEPGTLICVEEASENISNQVLETLKIVGLDLSDLDWVRPDLKRNFTIEPEGQWRRTMNGEIQFVVEGLGAHTAAQALMDLPPLEGSWKIPETATKKDGGAMVAIATVVGLVGGTMAIAEQIRKWYQEYKQANSDKKIEKVLIVGAKGQRILLENATLEQISKILEN